MSKKSEKCYDDFCRYYAEGHSAEESAVMAGFAPSYARRNSYKLPQRPYLAEKIEQYKEIAKKMAEEKFKYTVEQSFNKLKEIQDLAMEANQKDGEYYNLGTATKAEELKAKLCGLFEVDNKQKSLPISITFVNEYE